uniref:Uncharacterized protein n=1 Tax=Manihot esculenta TaxID=3983 RepID=A0A2C9UH02_MANES
MYVKKYKISYKKKVELKHFSQDNLPDFEDVEVIGDDEDEDEDEVRASGGIEGSKSKEESSKFLNSIKKQMIKDPLDEEFKIEQTTINDACKKELQKKAYKDIAWWIYCMAIPLNMVNYQTFQVMIESIGQ